MLKYTLWRITVNMRCGVLELMRRQSVAGASTDDIGDTRPDTTGRHRTPTRRVPPAWQRLSPVAKPAKSFQSVDRWLSISRASYEGARASLREQIVRESGIDEEEGIFSMETPPDQVATALFRFGQALTRIHDLTVSVPLATDP